MLLLLIVVVVPELLSGPKRPATPPPLTLPVPVHSYTVDVTDHSLAPTATAPTVAETVASAAASASAASLAAPSSEPLAPVAATAEATAAASRTATHVPEPLESQASPPTSGKSDTGNAVGSGVPVALPAHQVGGAWAVQLGSFASKSNAEKLVRTLVGKGYALTVSAAGSGAGLRYRVRVSSLADREAAEHVLGRLKAQGQTATLVPPAN